MIALALSGGVVSLGIALNDGSQATAGYSTPLVVVGAAGAAVCIALWVARAMFQGSRPAQARRESERFRRLAGELVACAKQADAKGVLTLADFAISEHRDLFARGVEMVVAAERPDVIRDSLSSAAGEGSPSAARSRSVTVYRVLPVVSLASALVMLIWMLATVSRPDQIGSLAPLGLLVAVYGSFAVAAVAVELGDRAAMVAAERELAAILVIETLVAIRSGKKADEVAAALGVAGAAGAPAETGALRRAA